VSDGGPVSFAATIERHHPGLPVYLIVPATVPAGFGRDATFVVEAVIDGTPLGRRTVKPWGDGRWFLEVTAAQQARLGVAEGDRVTVALVPAAEVPEDLAAAITEAGLEPAWHGLSAAGRRALAEPVFEARRPETRAKRIGRVIGQLAGRG